MRNVDHQAEEHLPGSDYRILPASESGHGQESVRRRPVGSRARCWPGRRSCRPRWAGGVSRSGGAHHLARVITDLHRRWRWAGTVWLMSPGLLLAESAGRRRCTGRERDRPPTPRAGDAGAARSIRVDAGHRQDQITSSPTKGRGWGGDVLGQRSDMARRPLTNAEPLRNN